MYTTLYINRTYVYDACMMYEWSRVHVYMHEWSRVYICMSGAECTYTCTLALWVHAYMLSGAECTCMGRSNFDHYVC